MPQPDEVPIKETNPIRAANPYSISKVGHDLMSQYYQKAYGLRIIITRMFSHEGSRRGKRFALSSFAYQIAQHEKELKKLPVPFQTLLSDGSFVVKVGNLKSVRTYAHISDAVRAYWLAATKGKVGEVYNIGGDHTCTVGEALENLLSKSIIPRKCFRFEEDPSRIRPTDITLQIPDCTKFKQQVGWLPLHDLDYISTDMLNYWRHEVAREV
jgi:GDP-D-mannose dehydratase